MQRRIWTSVITSAVVAGTLTFTGCGSSSSSTTVNEPGTDAPATETPASTAEIRIETGNGEVVAVDPIDGGTVVIRTNTDGTQDVATVLPSELNECASATDDNGTGIICGPKADVTYSFASAFGALGPVDDNASTPDGGVLLYDGWTTYDGVQKTVPVEGNATENRIETVYIPANYIKVTEEFKTKPINEQYDAMREYLANMGNIKAFATEDANTTCCNNPYFDENKTKGSFVATFVMQFSRGIAQDTLAAEFADSKLDNLEYLAVSFRLDVEQVDGNSSKLRFSVPEGSKIDFFAKKHGAGNGALVVTTDNIDLNSIVHETSTVDDAVTINMAKYFDKLIAKGDAEGVSTFAKEILVENAQNPWPVAVYGTLHEVNPDGTALDGNASRSFVRNPAKLDGKLFGLTNGTYGDVFNVDEEAKDKDNNTYPRGFAQAVKFCIVYPGDAYNELP